MDLFHTAFWSNGETTYRVWGSIYPPLVFMFLKLVRTETLYTHDAFIARDNDHWLILIYFLSIALLIYVVMFSRWRFHKSIMESIAKTVLLVFSLPFLYAVDRGNTIVWCYLLLFLTVHFYNNRNNFFLVLFIAIAINLKPYLILLAFPFLSRKEFRTFFLIALVSGGIYFVTVLLYGAGGPLDYLRNMSEFSKAIDDSWFNSMYFTFSLKDLLKIKDVALPLMIFTGSRVMAFVFSTFTLLHWLAVASCTLGIIILRRNGETVLNGMILWSTFLYLILPSVGGYFLSIPLIFLLQKQGNIWNKFSTWMLLFICLPFDLAITKLAEVEQFSFWSNSMVAYESNMSWGQIIRPVFFAFFAIAFVAELLSERYRSTRPAPLSGAGLNPGTSPLMGRP